MDPVETEANNFTNFEIKEENSPKRKFRKSLRRYVREYCENSSIQGLNYMIRKISCFERLWWIFVFIICIGGCTYMILEIWDKWESAPVLVSFATRDTPIFNLPFPAVTVCPEAKISKKCIDYGKVLKAIRAQQDVTPTEKKYFEYMSLLCDDDSNLVKNETFSEDFYQFLEECSTIEHELFICKWEAKYIPCKTIFRPIITDEGFCFTFNTLNLNDIYEDDMDIPHLDTAPQSTWNIEEGFAGNASLLTYPHRAILAGAKNSLTVGVLTNKKDLDHTCKAIAFQGIRVSLHMPARIPRPGQIFFSVPLDEAVLVAVIPSMITTSEKIEAYDPEKRDCYFSSERKLRYFKVYSQTNCHLECLTNYTLKHCGCVDYWMPRVHTTDLCGGAKAECLQLAERMSVLFGLEQKFFSNGSTTGFQDCKCLPLCANINYNYELSTAVWDWKHHLIEKIPNSSFNRENIDDYHLSVAQIFLKKDRFIPTERTELYGPTDFISNFGGILGLFTGFSLFSVAELLYFLSVRLIENYRRYGYWAGNPRN